MLSKAFSKDPSPNPPAPRGVLLTGGLAALLASTCCLGPLVLISLGFFGAWIGNLKVLQPYNPVFIAVALLALLLAWRRIWRPASAARQALFARWQKSTAPAKCCLLSLPPS